MDDERELEPKFGNPYVILGLEYGASEAEISKAYKRNALIYHPDKQKGKNQSETDEITKKFHALSEARAFLLDSEFTEKRKKYDAFLASQKHRKQEEEIRNKGMSDKRRKLREVLIQKEKAAEEALSSKKKSALSSKDKEKEKISNLQQEGRQMREELLSQNRSKEEKEKFLQQKVEEIFKREKLEERQVKIKWRRKNKSHSEDSLAILMKQFGTVSAVALINNGKGNSAIVTFSDPSSCKACVVHFLQSDEIRATFVGKFKNYENLNQNDPAEKKVIDSTEFESLEQMNLRQAAEREAIIRQLELEEEGIESKTQENQKHHVSSTDQGAYKKQKKSLDSFPMKMPLEPGVSPLERLEKFEKLFFSQFFPK